MPSAREFVAAVQGRFGDLSMVIAPATHIVFRQADLPLDGVTDIVFTSQNGVAGFARLSQRRDMRAWCVGGRTAEAARAAGFATQTGPGDAAGLLDAILTARPTGRVIWPRGHEAAVDIAKPLNSAGIETFSPVIYAADPCAPTPEATALLAQPGPVLLPLFSARSAAIVADWAQGCRAQITLIAISQGVADAASTMGATRIAVAVRPDEAAMLDALATCLHRDGTAGPKP